MSKLLFGAVFFIALFNSNIINTQTLSDANVQISYDNMNNLKACESSDIFQIEILNNSGNTIELGSSLEIQFPNGIMVDSFLGTDFNFGNYDAGTNSYTYNLNSDILSGQSSTIEFTCSAHCEIFSLLDNTGGNSLDVQNTLIFDYIISGSTNTLSGNTISYNVAQTNIKTTVPVLNQTITIPNNYDPFTQEVRFDVVGNSSIDLFNINFNVPSGLSFDNINQITYNGSIVSGFGPPISTGGSGFVLGLDASQISQISEFSTGDVVLVEFSFIPTCLNSVQIDYSTSILCHSDTCSFDGDQGFVNLVQIPPLSSASISIDSLADYCGNSSTITYTIHNEDISGYTIYNPTIYTNFGQGITYEVIEANGQPVVAGQNITGSGFTNILLSQLEDANGPILEDLDGDFAHDEIGPGDSVVITIEISLDSTLLLNCPANLSGLLIHTILRYRETNCMLSQVITGAQLYKSYTNQNINNPSINISGTIADGQNQTMTFCIDRRIEETGPNNLPAIILDDEILYGAEIYLPCGFELQNPSSALWIYDDGTTQPITINSSSNNGATTVTFLETSGEISLDSNEIEGCIQINTTFNCDTCSNFSTIEFNGYGTFENCNIEHEWACESVGFCNGCEPLVDCSTEGRINNSSLVVQRTSFGWTDENMTSRLTQQDIDANPNNYNASGAYACDSVNINFEGIVCGGVDDFKPYILYTKPAGVNNQILDFLDGTVTIDGVQNSVSITNAIDQGDYWKIEFTNFSGPFLDGTQLLFNAYFKTNKSTMSTPTFPYVLESDFTGVFYSNTPWLNGSSSGGSTGISIDSAITDPCYFQEVVFDFYKLEFFGGNIYSSLLCGINGYSSLLRIGVKGGTNGDDFPNEFRPFNSFVDSIVLKIDPSQVGLVDIIAAQVDNNATIIQQNNEFFTITPSSGEWPLEDKNSFQLDMRLRLLWDVACSASTPIFIERNYVHYTNFVYSSDSLCHEEDSLTGTTQINIESANLAFTFTNPIQSVTGTVTEYDLNVSNNSGFNAQFPWLLITYDPALVSIDISNSTYYQWSPNQIYVELGTMGSFANLSEIINVTPLVCDVEQTTQIMVQSGNHCSGYPSTPGSFDAADYCIMQTDTLELNILKSNLNLDLLTSFSPSNLVNHCDGEFSIILQIYNDEKADISDLLVQMANVPGLNLMGVGYNYPIAQGQTYDPFTFDWSMVNQNNFTVVNGIGSQDLLAGLNLGGIGLDANSTLNGILANDGVNLFNFYHLKLDFQINCDFDVNEELVFNIQGITNCGDSISISTSTFIDFLPPFDNLNIQMSVSEEGCDSNSFAQDISIQVINNDSISYDSLFVDLYCDVDGNGIFDPNIDIFLDQQQVSSGNNLNPGDTIGLSFISNNYNCTSGNFIAHLTDGNGCLCNYNYTSAQKLCCDCDTTSLPSNSIPIDTTWFNNTIIYYEYDYSQYAPIRNITGNPNHPQLFIYDETAITNQPWVYPQIFDCKSDFDTINHTVTLSVNILNFPLPHNTSSRVVYPPINQNGDTCNLEVFCTSNIYKNFCPYCSASDSEFPLCFSENTSFNNDSLVSIDENDNSQLIIYPNPFSENINISSSRKVNYLNIYDTRGKLILLENQINKTNFSIDLKLLSKGMYIINLYDDSNNLIRSEKLVK